VPIRHERTFKMNEYWMEIVGKILLFGSFLIAIVSQICIIARAFKIRYMRVCPI